MTFQRWVLMSGLVLAGGCSHAQKEVKAEAPAPPVAAAPLPMPEPAPVVERTCAADDQCASSDLCVSSRCVRITPGLAECKMPSTHFDFDRSDLHPDDMSALHRAARCLKALPKEMTLVEGNCDERGTVAYNLALGVRRASVVTRYLEDLGVPSSQLSTVSYGKELPSCTDSAESCWALNRRADISRGGQAKDVSAKIRADERRERLASRGESKAERAARPAAARRATHVRRGASTGSGEPTPATAR